MKKEPSFNVLKERIKQVVMAHCTAGGPRAKRMKEFVQQFGSKPNDKELEGEVMRVISSRLLPSNARTVLTSLLTVKSLPSEMKFEVVCLSDQK